MAGSLVFGGGFALAASGTAAPAALAYHQPSARFLSQARGALVSYLARGHRTDEFAHPTRAGVGNSTADSSYNWSGYGDTSTTNGTFTKVSAKWTTPAVTCTDEDTITSEWVGIDGFASNTVEQDGTISWCYEDVATYFTWYEMYPAGTISVGDSLKPGDKITATVTRAGTAYTLAVVDATHTANSFTEKKTCAATTCLDTSVEWIAERSAFSIGIAPLADYSTWKVTGATETAAGKTGTISSHTPSYAITMIDATEAYDLSTVSALTGGNAFTTTWHNSY